MSKIKLGQALEEARKKRGLNPYNISQNSRLSWKQASDLEKGKTNATIETLIEYCKALNIKLHEIIK